MSEIERRNWTAPDGVRYRVSLTERLINEGSHVRRVRRVEFVHADGRLAGDTSVPAYFTLDLAGSIEIEELWRGAVGG